MRWRDEDRVTLRSGGREPVIERRKAPTDAGARMAALVTDYEKAQLARIDQLFAFTNGDECRHLALARHLGHTIAPCGDHCDNCKTGAAHTAAPRDAAERAATLEALLSRLRADRAALRGTPLSPRSALIIVDCVASLPYELTKTALAEVATGRDGAVFSAVQVRGFGELQGPDRYDVPNQIDALVERGYLSADARGGQRLIGLGSEAAVAAAGAARPARDPDSRRAGRAYDRFASGAAEDWERQSLSRRKRIEPGAGNARQSGANHDRVRRLATLPHGPQRRRQDAHRVGRERGRRRPLPPLRRARHVLPAVRGRRAGAPDRPGLPGARPEPRATPVARHAEGGDRAARARPHPPGIQSRRGAGGAAPPHGTRQLAARRHGRRGRPGGRATSSSAEAADRFERLRLWRRTTAQREGLPPSV